MRYVLKIFTSEALVSKVFKFLFAYWIENKNLFCKQGQKMKFCQMNQNSLIHGEN